MRCLPSSSRTSCRVTGLDTKYAFQDRLLFPDNSAFKRIPMHHTDADNTEAAKRRSNC